MFFEKIKNGPEKKVDKKYSSYAKDHDIGDYFNLIVTNFNKKPRKWNSKSIFLYILSVIFLFLFPLIEYYQYGLDIFTIFQSENLMSSLHALEIGDFKLLKVLYLLRFTFLAFTTGFLLFFILLIPFVYFYDNLPKFLQFAEKLRPEEKYLESIVKNIKALELKDTKDFISYDKNRRKYRLVGFYSSLDPKKVFNAFLDIPLNFTWFLFILGLLLTSTTIISSITERVIFDEGGYILTEEFFWMLIVNINRAGTILIGISFIAISFWLYHKNNSKFKKFIAELVDYQQDVVTRFLLAFEINPNERNHLLKVHAIEEFDHLVKLSQEPQRTTFKILLPALSLIIPILIIL